MNDRPYEQPTQIRDGSFPWLRLLAFWFDISLVSAPVKLALFFADPDRYQGFVTVLYGIGPCILTVVTSLPLMALTTARWGTTAGKALLGCSVRRKDGDGNLSFTKSYQRSLTSFVVGAGAAFDLYLMVLTLFFCYRGLKYRGITFWDAVYKTRVERRTMRPSLGVVFIAGFIALLVTEGYLRFVTVYPLIQDALNTYLAAAVRIIVS